jgi:ammonium transporter, Amt family
MSSLLRSRVLFESNDDAVMADLAGVSNDVTSFYVIWAGTLILLMQAGFCVLESGSVRRKDAKNICLKSLMNVCVAAIGYFATGWAFAFGGDGGADANGFSGHKGFFLETGNEDKNANYDQWFVQFGLVCVVISIVSGAVAERCAMPAYIIFSAFISMFVYPIVSHWVWSSDGWLASWNDKALYGVGTLDFGGSGVVHLTGGVAALAAIAILGGRRHHGQQRYYKAGESWHVRHFTPNSSIMMGLGSLIIRVGFYGLNAANLYFVRSSDYIAYTSGSMGDSLGRIVVNSTLAAASSCFISLLCTYHTTKGYDLAAGLNGVLAGLVSIAAGSVYFEPWAAVVTGMIGALFYCFGSRLMVFLGLDDVTDSVAVHGFGGLWGLWSVGWFAYGNNVFSNTNLNDDDAGASAIGIMYGGEGNLFRTGVTASVVIIAWVGGMMALLFALLHWVLDLFRVKEVDEDSELDTKYDEVSKDNVVGGFLTVIGVGGSNVVA